MEERSYIARAIVLATMLLALVPLGQMVSDWYEVSQFEELLGTRVQSSASGYDWIEWEEVD